MSKFLKTRFLGTQCVTVAYNQSPDIDMPATKTAPNVITSANTIKLAANQRNPFICQVQRMQEASDP